MLFILLLQNERTNDSNTTQTHLKCVIQKLFPFDRCPKQRTTTLSCCGVKCWRMSSIERITFQFQGNFPLNIFFQVILNILINWPKRVQKCVFWKMENVFAVRQFRLNILTYSLITYSMIFTQIHNVPVCYCRWYKQILDLSGIIHHSTLLWDRHMDSIREEHPCQQQSGKYSFYCYDNLTI